MKDSLKCYGPKSEYRRLLRTTCLAERICCQHHEGPVHSKALHSILFNLEAYNNLPTLWSIAFWFSDFPVIHYKLYGTGEPLDNLTNFISGLMKAYRMIENGLPRRAKYNFVNTIYRYVYLMKDNSKGT